MKQKQITKEKFATKTDSSLQQWTWNLGLLLPNQESQTLEQERQEVQAETNKFVQKWLNRQDYLEKPKILTEALKDYEQWAYHFGIDGRQGLYFYLAQALDLNDSDIQAKITQVKDFATKLNNQIQFFLLNIAKIPPEKHQEFLDFPDLQPFKNFLAKIFQESKHLLSNEEEKIINYFSFHREKWIHMTESFLAQETVEIKNLKVQKSKQESESENLVTEEKNKEKTRLTLRTNLSKEEQKVNFGQLMSLLNHPLEEVRDEAAVKFNLILDKYKHVAEQELNAVLQHHKVLMELRKFTRPDQVRHLDDGIDSQLVDNLLAAVESRFDLAQKFYKLKAKLFGKKKLAYHERNVPFMQIEENFDWQKTLNLVRAAFAKLDTDFAKILDKFVNNRQIDVFPKVGKDSGAFCINYRLSVPTFVFLNHTNRFNDVLTFAHEMGHACNFEMMRKNNLQLNWDTSLFLAEAPSTFMEDLVLREVLKNTTDPQQKLAILMEKLNTDISTIQRQVACYRFEQDLHSQYQKTGYLSYQTIGKLFTKWMRAYMGPAVKQDPGSENWWIYWSHIRQHFYVYSYASGLLIAKFMHRKLAENKNFITKIKEFFAADASQTPTEILAKLEIQIDTENFWLEGLKETEKLLNQAKRLAKNLKLI